MRLRDRTRRDRDREEHRLGGDEFLPLRTTRPADPDRGAGKSINRQNVSRRTRRPEGRRDLELRSTDTVSSGADSRISELSQRPGLQAVDGGLQPTGLYPWRLEQVHGSRLLANGGGLVADWGGERYRV
nr:hypothetical protein Iba_chr09aCG3750 [Ipomoea batatas]